MIDYRSRPTYWSIVYWAGHYYDILENNCWKEVSVSELLIYDYDCLYLQSTSMALLSDKITFICGLYDKKTNILNFPPEWSQTFEYFKVSSIFLSE